MNVSVYFGVLSMNRFLVVSAREVSNYFVLLEHILTKSAHKVVNLLRLSLAYLYTVVAYLTARRVPDAHVFTLSDSSPVAIRLRGAG